jgi:hypothetical protein
MSLPNFVNKDDMLKRFDKSQEYYRGYGIPIGIIRKNHDWCTIVMWAEVGGDWFSSKLYDIRLTTDDQLSSVKELLEEVCDELKIPFRH